MSQQPIPYPPYPPYPTYVPPRPPGTGLGVAGFICSLLGLITCGILSPFGLLFSLIAVFKRPRGLAIAGVVLGCVGCCGGLIGLLVGAVGSLGALAGVGVAGQYVVAARDMDRIEAIVQSSIISTGNVPDDLASVPGLSERALRDPWGHKYQLIRREDSKKFDIMTSGADGVAGTFDDLSLREIEDGGGHRRRVKRSVHID